MERLEDYILNSLGYHVQTDNKDDFLSTDFGLKEFNAKSEKERNRLYRKYVYETRAIQRSNQQHSKIIDKKIVAKEQMKKFESSRKDRFMCRTRYLTDFVVIGTKVFVSANYQRFKDVFMSKREKVPTAVAGLDGICSLKRLVT